MLKKNAADTFIFIQIYTYMLASLSVWPTYTFLLYLLQQKYVHEGGGKLSKKYSADASINITIYLGLFSVWPTHFYSVCLSFSHLKCWEQKPQCPLRSDKRKFLLSCSTLVCNLDRLSSRSIGLLSILPKNSYEIT